MAESASPHDSTGDVAVLVEATPKSDTGRWGLFLSRASDLVRRYPATTAIVVAMLVVGVVTGALWGRVTEDSELYGRVAYGLPALEEGRWWTFFTGAFFVPSLVLYLPILVLVVGAASTYERRVGHWRTLLVTVGGQAAGALLTALLLWPFLESGWTWAAQLGQQLDLGISAGGFAVLGALTAVMQPVWRLRFRATVSAYLIAMVLNAGLLWDVEHFLAWLIGLGIGPLLVGRLPRRPEIRFGPRTQRAVVALVIAAAALSALLEAFFPGEGGPFHTGGQATHPPGVSFAVVMSAVVWLLVADGLRRGRRFAWALLTGVMAVTFLGLFAVTPSSQRTADMVLVGALLVLLLATFPAFGARPRERSFRRAGRRLAVVAMVLLVYTTAGFAVLRDDFESPVTFAEMLTEFFSRLVFTSSGHIEPATTAARWFLGSIGAVWILTVVLTVIGLVYSARRPLPEVEPNGRLRELLRSHEASSIEWMLTWKGNTIWYTDDGETAIGYRVVGSVALCLADPVGPMDVRLEALQEFDEHCFRNGWIPCMFAAGEQTASLAPQVGWKAIQVAEDAIVALEGLEFKGKAWQDVRTAMNKAGREEVGLEVMRWEEARPVITDQLHAISSGWVSDKSLPEMGFTLGTLTEADDPEVRLHVAVDTDSTVEGFTSWMPVSRDGEVVGWTVDLMRRREEGFRSVMEFLIGGSALQLKEEGYQFISLSGAPLAKAPEHLSDTSDQQVLQKLLDFLGETLEPYYGFRSLLHFKSKFQPEHRPMYLIYPDESALLEIGIAIARAFVPDATFSDWVRMTGDMVGSSNG